MSVFSFLAVWPVAASLPADRVRKELLTHGGVRRVEFASVAVYTEQSGFGLRATVCPVLAMGQASVQLQRDEGFSYTTNVPLLGGALTVTSCSLLRGEVTPQRRPRCWTEGERVDTHLRRRHKATFRLGCCAHVPSCELLAWRGHLSGSEADREKPTELCPDDGGRGAGDGGRKGRRKW